MQTKYYRDSSGWCGMTSVNHGTSQLIRIVTAKRHIGHGLATTVACHTHRDGMLTHCMGFGTGQGDYRETMIVSQPKRVTESLVREQHEGVIAQIEQIQASVELFYALKRKEQAATADAA